MGNEKILMKVKTDAVIGGVCKGLSEYLDLDVTLVRIVFVAAALFTAVGPVLLLYIILYVVLPEKEEEYKKKYKGTRFDDKKYKDEYAYDPEDYKL